MKKEESDLEGEKYKLERCGEKKEGRKRGKGEKREGGGMENGG